MNTYITTVFKSKTVWTAVLMFILAGFQAIEQSIPTNVYMLINAILTVAIAHFRATATVK